MGIFDFWKKKNHDWTLKADEKEQESKETYNEISGLLTNNQEALSKLAGCFDVPRIYFDENAERYEERSIERDAEKEIVWIAIVEELIESGDAIEIDWKEEVEEFAVQMKALAEKNHLKLRTDWFCEENDIPAWCQILDEKWEEQGFCVGAMDIDSDSYVLFICKIEALEKLKALGKKVNQRFDYAKNR